MSSEMGDHGVESRVSEPEARLLVKVREIEVVGCSGGIYLVLLRITFVNLAPLGRIVYHLGVRVTTIIKMLVSVRGDVRKREKVRFRPRKGGYLP